MLQFLYFEVMQIVRKKTYSDKQFVDIRKLYKIKHYLTLETSKVAAQNLIISRLDDSNSLLSGISKMDITKLQRVQNAAYRFFFCINTSRVQISCLTCTGCPLKSALKLKI